MAYYIANILTNMSQNKPNGQFMLEFEPAAIKAFTKDLPIRKIPGVGKVNERLLDSIGIKVYLGTSSYTRGSRGKLVDMRGHIHHRATLQLMDKQFGLHFLLQTYLGIASNIVEPGQREERKSIGAERSGPRNMDVMRQSDISQQDVLGSRREGPDIGQARRSCCRIGGRYGANRMDWEDGHAEVQARYLSR